METITEIQKLCKQLQKSLIQETVQNEQDEVLEDEFHSVDLDCITVAARK